VARAHFLDVVQDRYGNAVAGASVEVRQPGTATPITDPLYAASIGPATLSNPLTTDANGEFGFWLDTPQMVDLYVSGMGLTARTQVGVQVGVSSVIYGMTTPYDWWWVDALPPVTLAEAADNVAWAISTLIPTVNGLIPSPLMTFIFKMGTTEEDPGEGDRLAVNDNDDFGSVTKIFVAAHEVSGEDVSLVLDGICAHGGLFVLHAVTGSGANERFLIGWIFGGVDNGGWYTLNCQVFTHKESSTWIDRERIALVWSPGDAFTSAAPEHWLMPPSTVQAALDEIAARIYALEHP